MRLAASILPVALLAGCASGPKQQEHQWAEDALCAMERPWDSVVGADVLLTLVVRGWDPRTRMATSPAIDCEGRQIAWAGPGLACADNNLAQTILPPRPLGEEEVVVSQLGPDRQLVWVITNRYASGDAYGPVALVERTRRALLVRAQGVLRAFPGKARMRLEKLGSEQLLVAEGERCGAAGAVCDRTVRLLLLRGERFLPATFADDKGTCVLPGLVFLLREESDRLESGWRRRYELSSTLTFGADALSVQEQVVIRDIDPKNPTAPGRLFRRAEGDYSARLLPDGRFLTTGTPLWGAMRGRP